MNILNILGSPRKRGTSARIAQAFTEEAAARGADVETFYLNGMKYKGCQGCEKCHTDLDRCVLKDDLRPLLDGMRTADVVVLSTPVYFSDVSGQFKLFFDRLWSQVDVGDGDLANFTSRIPEGLRAVFIQTQGDVEAVHADVIERYRPYLDLVGCQTSFIKSAGHATGASDEDVSEAAKKACALAKELAS